MGAATEAPPSAREQIDAAHAALGDEERGDDARSRATEHPDAKKEAPANELPSGLEIEAGGQLSLEVGGKRPTAGTLTLAGGKVTLPKGQFTKGERIVVRVEAVVAAVKFQDQTDAKTRQVVGCERQHTARVENMTLVNAVEEEAAKQQASAQALRVDRGKAARKVREVLNEQSVIADDFVTDAIVEAVLGS